MIMHLDKVPAREEGMTPYDVMLSESQERMLICAKKGCEQAIIDIFQKWELDVAVIGEVTNTGNMELFWHGEKVADIPVQKWELDVAVIGEVTSSGHMELFWHGEKVADIPVQPVSEEAPVLDRPVS